MGLAARRCTPCAGWFLIGDLGIDWRLGAEWFESALIDYEPTVIP